MTGIDPKRLERRLRWAAEQLGLRPDASLDEVRAAWLRRLPAEDFVPSSELRWALASLLRRPTEGGWETRADEAASAAEEERLRGEVEAFAEKFWELPLDERRRCWQELLDRCAFAPALRARLRLLEAGIDCVPAVNETKESPRVVELANTVCSLFVLRPGLRASARQDLLHRLENDRTEIIRSLRRCRDARTTLRRIDDDRKAWKAAARRLRRVCPHLASLGKDLLDRIVKKPPKAKPLGKLRALLVAAAGAGFSTSRWRSWLWPMIVGTLVAVGRILTTDSNHSPHPSTPSIPSWPAITTDKTISPGAWKKEIEAPSVQDKKLKEKRSGILK